MSERLYTEKEVAELQASEAKVVLEGLLRNLADVRIQRIRSTSGDARQQGEIWGLDVAIKAIRRRIR